MTYDIEWHPGAERYLAKLQPKIAARILNKLDQVQLNPFRYLEHFEGVGYKLRIGDFRAVIDVDFTRKILFVRILDKRGRIYK